MVCPSQNYVHSIQEFSSNGFSPHRRKTFHVHVFSGIPLTDPNFYATITKDKLAHVFRSDSEYEIPLIEERLQVIQEAGKVLLEKYHGKVENVMKACDKRAQTLLKIVTTDFPSYRYTVKLVLAITAIKQPPVVSS